MVVVEPPIILGKHPTNGNTLGFKYTFFELTLMPATQSDYPFEDPRKLTHRSDVVPAVPKEGIGER